MVIVYNVDKPAQVERLIRELWRKHSGNDHCMGEDGFGNAVCELLDSVFFEGKIQRSQLFVELKR